MRTLTPIEVEGAMNHLLKAHAMLKIIKVVAREAAEAPDAEAARHTIKCELGYFLDAIHDQLDHPTTILMDLQAGNVMYRAEA